jgi:hypothetical protein
MMDGTKGFLIKLVVFFLAVMPVTCRAMEKAGEQHKDECLWAAKIDKINDFMGLATCGEYVCDLLGEKVPAWEIATGIPVKKLEAFHRGHELIGFEMFKNPIFAPNGCKITVKGDAILILKEDTIRKLWCTKGKVLSILISSTGKYIVLAYADGIMRGYRAPECCWTD